MPAHRDVLFRPRSPFTWRHRELTTNACDPKHRRRRASIELPVEPLNELLRRGVRQRAGSRHSIHFRLNAYVRGGLELEVAAHFVLFEIPRERPFDFAWARVMPFDEIAVVGVHDANDVRKVDSGARAQRTTQFGRCRGQLGRQVSHRFRWVLKPDRLDVLDTFQGLVWPI
jgi:hypothetical protein